MENLPFLEGESPNEEVLPAETVAETVETPPEPQPEVAPEVPAETPEQPRDDKGRFISKQEEVAPAQPTQPPAGYVPVSVVQALRQELNGLKAAQQPAPDIFEDSAGFVSHQVQPVRDEITQLKLDWSRRFAEQAYTVETVNAAEQWVFNRAQVDPALGQRILASPDPYGAAVAEYKRDQINAKISDPAAIDRFLAWEAAQANAQAQPQAAPAAQPQSPTPTRSLATAPSSGGAAHVPTGPGQAFDSLFTR